MVLGTRIFEELLLSCLPACNNHSMAHSMLLAWLLEIKLVGAMRHGLLCCSAQVVKCHWNISTVLSFSCFCYAFRSIWWSLLSFFPPLDAGSGFMWFFKKWDFLKIALGVPWGPERILLECSLWARTWIPFEDLKKWYKRSAHIKGSSISYRGDQHWPKNVIIVLYF